jgi:hypothetical protein
MGMNSDEVTDSDLDLVSEASSSSAADEDESDEDEDDEEEEEDAEDAEPSCLPFLAFFSPTAVAMPAATVFLSRNFLSTWAVTVVVSFELVL